MRSCAANVVSKDCRDGLGRWGPVAKPVRGLRQEGIPRPRFPQLVSVAVTVLKEIPEVSGTVSCPAVTVNSEPVVLTSITMEKGCG